MPGMQRVMLAALIGFGGLIGVNRLKGSGEPGTAASVTQGAKVMKGAVYAGAIPLYPGAKLEDVMGGNYYENVGGPVTFRSTSWFFKVSDPVDKVTEFYRKNLPQGSHPVEAQEGDHAFEWVPPGAVAGEEVSVTVREGEVQIGETIKAKN